MQSTHTTANARRTAPDKGPVSVVLPAELRAQLAHEAKRRELKLSTVMRVLVAERMQQIEDADQLSRAEEFQRAQAWAAWDTIKGGDRREVSRADLDAEFEAARRRASRRSPRRK